MTAIELLQGQIISARELLKGTMDGVTQKELDYIPDGKAISIGANYAHHIIGEDLFVNTFLRHGQPLMTREYKDKTGLSEPMPAGNWEDYGPWTKRVKVNLEKLTTYFEAVKKETDAYLSSIHDADLTKSVDMSSFGMGESVVWIVLADYIIGHMNSISGEISALKGIQGLKGYPF